MKKKERRLIAEIVSPEEIKKAAPQKLILPDIIDKALPSKNFPVPSVPAQRSFPPQSVRRLPDHEKPLVTGEGKDEGIPLSDRGYPEAEEPGRKAGSGSVLPGQEAGRGMIFDAEIIGRLAEKEGKGNTQNDSAITFDTKEYRYSGYMRKLKERIESIWEYPPDAKRQGIYGDLRIRFVILKNGMLGAVELVRTSGYKLLDDAAIRALQEGEPYWPLPDEWGMDSYTVMGHFIYSMYGYHIR